MSDRQHGGAMRRTTTARSKLGGHYRCVDRREAILEGQTRGFSNPYTIRELMGYLQFWFRTSVARRALAW